MRNQHEILGESTQQKLYRFLVINALSSVRVFISYERLATFISHLVGLVGDSALKTRVLCVHTS